MIDGRPDGRKSESPGGRRGWIQYGILVATGALVIGVYVYTARSDTSESLSLNPADASYNLLVQGFRTGRLSLNKDAPSGLRQLADPYDPAANAPYWYAPYRMHDLSYYNGRLYLYFGVTPALLLFWPFVTLTGHYLFQEQAVTIFCAIGFLASVGLLRAIWRRYFAEVSVGVVAACAFALGLATGVPMLLARSDLYEVPISCGYMLTMLALGAIWCALHEPERRTLWLAAASLSYGLAVGARPSLLLGAVILLVPVIQAWREGRKVWVPLMMATAPLVLIGLGLLLYNALRFDNPFEFGWRYQLAEQRQDTVQRFSLRYLWFNFRVCFLEPARWSGRFPFVHDITTPPWPAGHGQVEHPFGVLTNIPLVWLALAVTLAGRGRSLKARSILSGFLMVVTVLFASCTLIMGLFFAACFRYEVEFLSTLVLLAVIGILSLERTLAPTSGSGLAGHRVWRRAVRGGWGLLLVFSVAFNLLASAEHSAETENNLAGALEQEGRVQEAIGHYEQALRINPGYFEAHNNLGNVLLHAGRIQEAISHCEQALKINPDYAEAHNNLGNALSDVGDLEGAIGQFEQAVRINRDIAAVHYNFGNVFFRAGKAADAIRQFDEALRINPRYFEAHNNLGNVLLHAGRIQEAISHCEQALKINPDFAEAHNNLGNALSAAGDIAGAIEHYERAGRINPDHPDVQYNLGVALERAGRVRDAIGHYEQAVRLKPNFTEAQNKLAQLRAAQ